MAVSVIKIICDLEIDEAISIAENLRKCYKLSYKFFKDSCETKKMAQLLKLLFWHIFSKNLKY